MDGKWCAKFSIAGVAGGVASEREAPPAPIKNGHDHGEWGADVAIVGIGDEKMILGRADDFGFDFGDSQGSEANLLGGGDA